jgi:hypothetical protein
VVCQGIGGTQEAWFPRHHAIDRFAAVRQGIARATIEHIDLSPSKGFLAPMETHVRPDTAMAIDEGLLAGDPNIIGKFEDFIFP